MLSEHALQSGQAAAARPVGEALPALGFEPSQGGQSYGLEELVQKEPAFGIGRVQYPLNSNLLCLACSNNVLVLVVSGTSASAPARLIRIDLAYADNERAVELFSPNSLAQTGASSSSNTNSRAGTPAQSAGNPADYRLFLDPSGRHALVSTSQGDNYYFFSSWEASSKRARLLPKLRGVCITAVAWNSPLAQSTSQAAQSTQSTKEILLGDSNGNIYECVLDGAAGSGEDTGSSSAAAAIRNFARSGNAERHFKLVYSLSGSSSTNSNKSSRGSANAITGLRAEIWSASSSSSSGANAQKRRAALIVTTSTRLYQFIGSVPAAAATVSAAERDEGGMYDDLFKAYRETLPKSLELPGELGASELHLWQATKDKALQPPKRVAWMTSPGIYNGSLSYSSQEAGDGIIDSAQLVPYPVVAEAVDYYDPNPRNAASKTKSEPEQPISMAVTEHHFVLLYRTMVQIIRTVDDRVVFQDTLDIREGEKVQALATDMLNKTYWIYTPSSIFEVSVANEDQELWRVHLDKQSYDTALKFAKTPQQRSLINAAQGDAFFSQARYIQAAESYALSNKSFEEVVLRFTDAEERDALRFYLVRCLERLKKNDLTQRMMLATWLVEIYLSKINQLEDIAASESASDDVENYRTERAIVEDDMKQFLQQYKDNLDKTTVFDLISSHGRSEMLLHYASVVGDYGRIVSHWIKEEDWQAALLALARQEELEPYYRYAPVLLRNVPKATVDAFLRQSALQPRRLLPALVQPGEARPELVQQAVRYLEHAIFTRHHIDPPVHNALLTLLASRKYANDTNDTTESDLLHFLQTAPLDEDTRQPYYDLDYALRVCKANNRIRSCVEIYTKMGLYEASVELALQYGDIELAKHNADLPMDDELQRKKLWLKIAENLVKEKNDLKTAMQFLESTSLLKIEDILPFFPDFVTIDDFKEDICDALEEYGNQIESLKAEMATATEAADAIKRDIADLQNRFVVVDAAAKCDSCRDQLLTRQFYVFPCQHAFHADCLIREVTQHLPSHTLRRVLDLQNQIAREAKETEEKAAQVYGPSAVSDTLGLESLGLVSGRKLAQASVQGLDQLRKLVIPDALVTVVGGGILGAVGRDNRVEVAKQQSREVSKTDRKSKQERMREELDDLLASTCVYCDMAVSSLDRPFLTDNEAEI